MPDTKFMGFKPAQKVYFITGEYPNENYDSGHIKLLFESFRENIPWAALTVFPMQQLNKPCAELLLTPTDAKTKSNAAVTKSGRNIMLKLEKHSPIWRNSWSHMIAPLAATPSQEAWRLTGWNTSVSK